MGLLADIDKLLFGSLDQKEPSFEELVEAKARELHKIDSDKCGHHVMVGERGIYPIRWPTWEEFSEDGRDDYRAQARELMRKT